jgi:hypothetical protein
VALPLFPMALVLLGLLALNVVHRLWLRHAEVTTATSSSR